MISSWALTSQGAVPAGNAEPVILQQVANKSNRRNRVKTTLFAASLVVALSLSAVAAQKKPPVSQHLKGSPETSPVWTGQGDPPALCDPCLFYGGDLNPVAPNAAGMSDENTLFIPGSSTYASFNVASGAAVTITGILVNVQASVNFDPLTASYDVRTGVTEGNGGTSIASGTGAVQVAATGRNFIGLNEYSVAVQLSTPLLLGPGRYWFNVTPSCTNGATDGSCVAGRIFVSNTTQRTNSVYGIDQTDHQMYLNSPFFGISWANWCDADVAGFNKEQCRDMSYGLIGTHQN
jgi:hypothetical protein